MSKEFVPGVGLTSLSSSLEKKTSELVASAREFVPSTSSDAAGMNTAASEWHPHSKSNTGDVVDGSHYPVTLPENPEYHLTAEVEEIEHEQLVEVAWNGGTYLIPASMAFGVEELTLQQQQQIQPSTFDGLDWCMYMSSLPTPRKRNLQAVGITEPMRQHFQGLDLNSLRQMEPEDERYKEIPPRFHSAYPLDDPSLQRGAGGSFGYPSSLYKVVDRVDGQTYTLRRFDNVRTITPSVLNNSQSNWAAIRHPSIVSLYSISMEKGAVFFTHAFHPSAQTLQERFLNPKTTSINVPVNESLLWRLTSQILTGIRYVHSRDMAVRAISEAHILVTSGARFRIANVGVMDVLEFESRKTLSDMQREDLFRLGCVVLSVAVRMAVGPKDIDRGMSFLQQHFSQELYQFVGTMLSGKQNVHHLCALASDKLCDELDFALASSDALHLNLQNEYENGRLLRLLLKLGFINERPEHALSPSWSETGDRYVLKLFRDYLFHQINTDGVPQIDMGHVVSSLNKLDTGDREQILLSSRNGNDILVASFFDINRCLDSAFVDLMQQAKRLDIHQQPHHQSLMTHYHLQHQQHPVAGHKGGGIVGGGLSYTPQPHVFGGEGGRGRYQRHAPASTSGYNFQHFPQYGTQQHSDLY